MIFQIQYIDTNCEVQFNDIEVIRLKDNQFLIPGFVDCHIHAVQFPNMGIGYDKYLLEWLDTYTFPQELKFSDNLYAEKVMHAVVVRYSIYFSPFSKSLQIWFMLGLNKFRLLLFQNKNLR